MNYCTTCGARSWGPECQYSCTVFEDDRSRYACTDQCGSGFYFKDEKCHQCPENCETCLKYTGCDTCGARSWGPECQYSCTVFEDDSSHYACTDQCGSGFYFKDQKCHQCPENCETCLKYTGCDTCGARSWGPKCQYSCTVFEDDSSHYACTDQCGSGFYFKDQKCHQCPENCETCLKYTGCDTCGARSWGPECQYSCSVCEDCSRHTCTDQCGSGLYLKDNICHRCPENCETCLKHTGCNTCDAGLWGPSCDYECSDFCNGTECERDDGACEHGCIDGYTGTFCDKGNVTMNEE